MTARHVLTITPYTSEISVPPGISYEGHLLYEDGTEARFYAQERAQIIGKAQRLIEVRGDTTPLPEPETLVLDNDGIVVSVSHPGHSVKVEERVADPALGWKTL